MIQDQIHWYGEYEFPKDIKDLYYGMTGTNIFKLLLDQYIQESGSQNAINLKNTEFNNFEIFGWKDNVFAYALTFPNQKEFMEWKNNRKDFKEWLEEIYNIVCVYKTDSLGEIHDESLGTGQYWKIKNKICLIIPHERGFL